MFETLLIRAIRGFFSYFSNPVGEYSDRAKGLVWIFATLQRFPNRWSDDRHTDTSGLPKFDSGVQKLSRL
jgi:hypothetical protein